MATRYASVRLFNPCEGVHPIASHPRRVASARVGWLVANPPHMQTDRDEPVNRIVAGLVDPVNIKAAWDAIPTVVMSDPNALPLVEKAAQ